MRATAALLAVLAVGAAPLVRGTPALHAQSQPKPQDGRAVIGRSASVYRSLRSLRADFVQVIDNPMLDSATSRGTLVQSGEARFAMRFTDPPGEAIVVDGEHIWIYTPSTTPGQVIRMPIPSGGPVYGYNILAWLLDRPSERYTSTLLRSERVDGRTADVVELIPTVSDLPFDRAVIWLDREDGLPRHLEIQEKSGGKRMLTLSKLRTNASIPDKTFKLDLPAGTHIVDQ